MFHHYRLPRFGFGPFLLTVEVLFMVLYGMFVEYDPEASTSDSSKHEDKSTSADSIDKLYPMHQDIAVMVFFGIGFLISYLKHHAYTSLGLNFIIGAISVQWALLLEGWRSSESGRIQIQVKNMISANAGAATVLISYGAVIGKVSPLQALVMALLEMPLYVFNAHLVLDIYQVSDPGGSIFLHVFSAYFGMAVAFVLYNKDSRGNKKESSSYYSDIFAIAGTIFLWIYWPSFNAALQEGTMRHRTIINNWLALTASCVVTFAVSPMMDKKGKFNMSHIQNATLGGGVAIGSVVNLLVQPAGAIALGAISAIVVLVGGRYLSPWFAENCRLHDTCGIHNLHGLPGLLGGLASVFLVFLATESNYHSTLYDIYPAMVVSISNAPPTLNGNNTLANEEWFWKSFLRGNYSTSTSAGRSRQAQALFQLVGIIITLLISIIGGLFTGLVLKFPFFDIVPSEKYFDDSRHWLLPSETEDSEDTPTDCQGSEDNKI